MGESMQSSFGKQIDRDKYWTAEDKTNPDGNMVRMA